jgi:hypothetical protein
MNLRYQKYRFGDFKINSNIDHYILYKSYSFKIVRKSVDRYINLFIIEYMINEELKHIRNPSIGLKIKMKREKKSS